MLRDGRGLEIRGEVLVRDGARARQRHGQRSRRGVARFRELLVGFRGCRDRHEAPFQFASFFPHPRRTGSQGLRRDDALVVVVVVFSSSSFSFSFGGVVVVASLVCGASFVLQGGDGVFALQEEHGELDVERRQAEVGREVALLGGEFARRRQREALEHGALSDRGMSEATLEPRLENGFVLARVRRNRRDDHAGELLHESRPRPEEVVQRAAQAPATDAHFFVDTPVLGAGCQLVRVRLDHLEVDGLVMVRFAPRRADGDLQKVNVAVIAHARRRRRRQLRQQLFRRRFH
mmetsp:Transcript_18015/g.55146  ORF Transcript_18015/g.55146 Transcript_18015/m.55146 type:complete len:291 (+) Transcript_18015:636-1508(+)